MPAVSHARRQPVRTAPRLARDEVLALFDLPFTELLHRAGTVHREHFDPTEVQVSHAAVDQDRRLPRGLRLLPAGRALRHRRRGHEADEHRGRASRRRAQAKAAGASRFCMGAAWRSPKDRDIPKVAAMIREVKALGLETCATLGMLSDDQADALKDAGLDYYNHNLDTAPEFYGEIIHTREYQDRLDTLAHVRDAGLKTCCGGIVGMGESREQRAGLLQTLANLPAHPDSVPINRLVQVEGTPLRGHRATRSVRIRAHDRGRAHADAAVDGAPVRRPRSDERRTAGAVLRRRRQLDLLRREAADHRQSRHRARPALFARLGLRPMHGGTAGRRATTQPSTRARARSPPARARGLSHARRGLLSARRRSACARNARRIGARARAPHASRAATACAARSTAAGCSTSAATITSACRSSSRVVSALQDARRAATARAASRRTWSAATTPSTTRSSASSPTGSARRARCCSAAATWPTSRCCRRCSATTTSACRTSSTTPA